MFDARRVANVLHGALSGDMPLVGSLDVVLDMAASAEEPPLSSSPVLLDGLLRVALSDDVDAAARGSAALVWLSSASPRAWAQLVRSGALHDAPIVAAAVTDALLCPSPPCYLPFSHPVLFDDLMLGSRLRSLCVAGGGYAGVQTPLNAAVSHAVDTKQKDKTTVALTCHMFETLAAECWDGVCLDDFTLVVRILTAATGPMTIRARAILDGEVVQRKLCVGFCRASPAKGRMYALLATSPLATSTRAAAVASEWCCQDAEASGFKIGNISERLHIRQTQRAQRERLINNKDGGRGKGVDNDDEEDGEIGEEEGVRGKFAEKSNGGDFDAVDGATDDLENARDGEQVVALCASGVAKPGDISAVVRSRGWGTPQCASTPEHQQLAAAAYIAAPEAMRAQALELQLSNWVEAAPMVLRGPVDDAIDAAVLGILAHIADVRVVLGITAPISLLSGSNDAEKEAAVLKSVQPHEVRLRRLALSHAALVRRRRGALCGGVHTCLSSALPYGPAAVVCATVLMKSMRGMGELRGRNGCVFAAAAAGVRATLAEGRREHGVGGRFRELAKAATGLLLHVGSREEVDVERLESKIAMGCDCPECVPAT
jgi:hypothetical protein